MTHKGTGPAGVGDGAEKQTTGRGAAGASTLLRTPDETDRPRCAVVGVYCEALGWLRREPQPAAVCCRSYWAEAVAS
jgi:hypothetical protein